MNDGSNTSEAASRPSASPEAPATFQESTLSRNSKPNFWEKRYGAIRRAKDKAYLEEAERQISVDEAVALAFENICRPEAESAALGLNHANERQSQEATPSLPATWPQRLAVITEGADRVLART